VTGEKRVIGSPYTVKSIFEPKSSGPGYFFQNWDSCLISFSTSYYTNLPKETRGFHLWPEILHFHITWFMWCTLYSEFWNLESLGYLPYKFRLRKVKPWVLFSKFHRRTNLMALLVTILGFRNQNYYSEFWNLTS
jgi:hypothetical protein